MLSIRRTGSAEYGRFIKALVCGDPGAGKTLLASQFPNPFYLTTEALMMSIADKDIPYHHVQSLGEVEFALEMLKQVPEVRERQFGFTVETVVVDTIDDLSDMLLKQKCAEEKHATPQLQDYGWLKKTLASMTGAFRNLDMNVVFTSHLKVTEVAGVTTYRPAIEGGFSEKVAAFFDLAVVLRSEMGTKIENNQIENVLTRYMQTQPDLQYGFIKDHSGKLPPRFDLDFQTDYQRLYDTIFGGRTDLGLFRDKKSAMLHLLNATQGNKDLAKEIWDAHDFESKGEWKADDLDHAVALRSQGTDEE